MTPPKGLIWFTLIALIGISTAVVVTSAQELPPAVEINTEGQPTIGYPKAAVHVVVIEEPKCADCKRYNNFVFPAIKQAYIDTNKIQYTVIPVSFLPHSMPAAIALLCIYKQDPQYNNPDLFFTYLDYIYRNEPPEHVDWVNTSTLVSMAQGCSPAIKLDTLPSCIDKQEYFTTVSDNTEYARTLLGGTVSTPSVFVNGRRVSTLSVNAIKKLIDASLEEKGVSP